MESTGSRRREVEATDEAASRIGDRASQARLGGGYARSHVINLRWPARALEVACGGALAGDRVRGGRVLPAQNDGGGIDDSSSGRGDRLPVRLGEPGDLERRQQTDAAGCESRVARAAAARPAGGIHLLCAGAGGG